jgi:hypothetical protein
MRTGRPRLKKALKKVETIHIRLTEEQKGELVEASRYDGVGVSTWLLTLGLKEARARKQKPT